MPILVSCATQPLLDKEEAARARKTLRTVQREPALLLFERERIRGNLDVFDIRVVIDEKIYRFVSHERLQRLLEPLCLEASKEHRAQWVLDRRDVYESLAEINSDGLVELQQGRERILDRMECRVPTPGLKGLVEKAK